MYAINFRPRTQAASYPIVSRISTSIEQNMHRIKFRIVLRKTNMIDSNTPTSYENFCAYMSSNVSNVRISDLQW